MIRLALVGFGKWGRNYVKAAEDSGESEVVQTLGARDFDSNQLRFDVDAVVYAGHPAGAVAACQHALSVDLPILCEKPAGLSLADAERIAAAEAASKAFVLVGHQHLFAEGMERIHAMGTPRESQAHWSGPAVHSFSHLWDYGPHAVSAMLALGGRSWMAEESDEKTARVWGVSADGVRFEYDGYAPQEPPLTRQVRAFAKAVRAGGTDDYRFGAKRAVDVARVLESAEKSRE